MGMKYVSVCVSISMYAHVRVCVRLHTNMTRGLPSTEKRKGIWLTETLLLMTRIH